MARTYYSDEQKKRIVREVLETGNAAAVARRHEINPNLISRWIKKQCEVAGTQQAVIGSFEAT